LNELYAIDGVKVVPAEWQEHDGRHRRRWSSPADIPTFDSRWGDL